MKNWFMKEVAAIYTAVDTLIKDAVYTACLIVAVLGLLLLAAVVTNNKLQIGSETREYTAHVPMNDIRLVLNQSNLKILYSLEERDRFLLKDKLTIEIVGPKKDRSEAWLAVERVMNE